MEDTTLASELDRLQAMARALGACVVHDQGAPPAARHLCAALSASVDRVARLAGSASDNAGPGKNNGKQRNSCRTAAKVRRQVRVASVQDTRPLHDGLSWRKYGQKDILGTPYPRAYFRCTHRHSRGCHATKHVQRAAADPLLFDVVYNGAHTCDQQIPTPTPSLLTSPELQQPPGSSPEQGLPAATGAQTIQWPVEPLTPCSFPSSPAGAIDDDGCSLLASYGYGATGGLGAVMELDELFFTSSEFFQSEVQSP